MASPVATGSAWEHLVEAGKIDERLVATSVEPAREPQLAPIPDALSPDLVEALGRAGIERLYSHQVAAREAAGRGNVITTSGTASGKSLSFNLPVLDAIARE